MLKVSCAQKWFLLIIRIYFASQGSLASVEWLSWCLWILPILLILSGFALAFYCFERFAKSVSALYCFWKYKEEKVPFNLLMPWWIVDHSQGCPTAAPGCAVLCWGAPALFGPDGAVPVGCCPAGSSGAPGAVQQLQLPNGALWSLPFSFPCFAWSPGRA